MFGNFNSVQLVALQQHNFSLIMVYFQRPLLDEDSHFYHDEKEKLLKFLPGFNKYA